MNSIRFWPVAALSAASLLGLAACSPAGQPYEPPPPAPEAPPPPAAESTPVEAAAVPAAPEAVADLEEPHDHDEGHAGEPHVHGGGDLAITREDDFLTVTLDAPLANFGLAENKAPQEKKAETYASGIATAIGPTTCEETERSVDTRINGEHGAMTISVVLRCKKIDRVEGIRINLFDMYPGFHHVDAIYLGPNGEQIAKELTPTDTEIDFD